MARAGDEKTARAEEDLGASQPVGAPSWRADSGPLQSGVLLERERADPVLAGTPGWAARRALWCDVFLIVGAIAAGIAVASWLSLPGRVRRLEESDQVGTYIRGRVAVTRHQDIYEVGTVGSTFQTRIEVTNPWDIPLDVQEIRASCNCTTPVLPQRHLEPRQSVGMDVQAAVPPTGVPISIRIDLACQRGYRLVHLLKLVRLPRIATGAVGVDAVGGGDGSVDVGDVPVGKTVERQFSIAAHYSLDKSFSEAPVRCTVEGDSQVEIIAVGPLQPVEAVGNGAIGRVHIPISVRIRGDFERSFCVAALQVLLEYADGTQSRHPLGLRWNVERIVTCEPPRLFVELPKDAAQPYSERLVVEAVAGRVFRITSISSEAKWLSAQIVASKPDNVEVAAVVDADQIQEWATGDLRIMTDIPEQPVVVVPVSVRRRSVAE